MLCAAANASGRVFSVGRGSGSQFLDDGLEGRLPLVINGRVGALGVDEGVKRLVAAVDDVDFVVSVGFRQEDAEVGVDEIEVDGGVRNLDDRIVPPGNAFLLVEGSRDALVERVFEQHALTFGGALVRGPTGIGDDRKQHQAEADDGSLDKAR